MKINVKQLSFDEVMKRPVYEHRTPKRQSAFWRWVMKTASSFELKSVGFENRMIRMDEIGDDVPCLYLMNHSSFIDLEIASTILKKKPFHIVCTNDGFVGKAGLMYAIGCLPARKFITDLQLVKDMKYVTGTLKESVLMYPEASYSFDGTQTPLPDSLGKCVKMLGVPVVMIRTHGAFLRDPLYNCLQKRNVKVTSETTCLLTREEVGSLSAKEINARLQDAFSYDHFREQKESGIRVTEPFRADGLHRVLYKCPHCLTEGRMIGKGTSLTCRNCDSVYTLSEDGSLILTKQDGVDAGDLDAAEAKFSYVSDWYAWERECVNQEIMEGSYLLDTDVKILLLTDFEAVYDVGEGHLCHDKNGFELTGCGGKLCYRQAPKASYSLYADYFWYEIGDMIAIGDQKVQYYCFPKDQDHAIVAKARLAAEEMVHIG